MTDPTKDIQAILDKHAADTAAGDARAVMAAYTADAEVFDLPPPLQVEADADGLQQWLDSWDQPPTVAYRDLNISVSGDFAMASGFTHTAVRRDGEDGGYWTRNSWAFRRDNGAWKIAHTHCSVPFYMDDHQRAALDLEPGTGKAETGLANDRT